jgi:hypothetical protein
MRHRFRDVEADEPTGFEGALDVGLSLAYQLNILTEFLQSFFRPRLVLEVAWNSTMVETVRRDGLKKVDAKGVIIEMSLLIIVVRFEMHGTKRLPWFNEPEELPLSRRPTFPLLEALRLCANKQTFFVRVVRPVSLPGVDEICSFL